MISNPFGDYLFDAGEETRIAHRLRGLRWIRSGSASRRTATGLDSARHRASIAEWNRSRATNSQGFPRIQNTLRKPRKSCRCGAGSPWPGRTWLRRQDRCRYRATGGCERRPSGRDVCRTQICGPDNPPEPPIRGPSPPQQRQNFETARRHEVGFYSDDRSFLDDLTEFIGPLSMPGMRRLLSRLSHTGTAFCRDCRRMAWILALRLSWGDISLDAAETLSTFMHNGMPDPVRCLKVAGDLVRLPPRREGRSCRRCRLRRMCASPVGAR